MDIKIRSDEKLYMEELKSWLREESETPLEEMGSFFEKRVGGYEEHMSVWKEAYRKMALLVPEGTENILDLGCGTGLELDEIFKVQPEVYVTGIDLCPAMLEKLKEKHGDKEINIICGDYFTVDLEKEIYDLAISFESLHHFTLNQKKELYRKMEILASKIEEYRAEEDSIKETLLTAQKAASKVEKEAKEKSEKLLSDSAKTVQATVMDAKAKAEKIISEAREYASQITKEKADAAEAILNEAREKADKELADAKADAAGLLTEAKNISQELLTKSKEEKDYYENLTNNLKIEADSFKEKLVALYNAQLEKLTEMMESPVAAETAEIEDKIDETQQNIETVSAKIDEIEQDMAENEDAAAADEYTEAVQQDAPEEQAEQSGFEEAEPQEEKNDDDFDVEYALEEISEEEASEPEEEPDVHDAIDAFSQTQDSEEVTEIHEEPEMEQSAPAETEDEGHLPFEDFFHVKPEGVRTNEKISLIPPDEDDDEDDEGVKFKGFFKNKKKKK